MEAAAATTCDLGNPEQGARVAVRFFAAARQAAGTTEAQAWAETVADVLRDAAAAFGPSWAAVAATSRTWVNGEPASPTHRLVTGDEVAVLPPVSGGAA